MSVNTYDDRLQTPLPVRFRVPPLIQPQWRLSDLIGIPVVRNRIVGQLKEEICRQYGVKYCVLVDRARTGIYLTAQILNLTKAWMTSSFMHRPTGVLIANLASDIQFVDLDDDFNLDPEKIECAINDQTQVLFVTHMYGKPANICRMREISDKHNLVLIENSVHMCGNVNVNGKRLGSWGDVSVLSFNVDKPVGGILGGALLTNRKDIYEAVSRLNLVKSDESEVVDRVKATYLAYRLKPLIMRSPMSGRFMNNIDAVSEIESFPVDEYKSYMPRRISTLQARVALTGFRRLEEYKLSRRIHAERLTAAISGPEDIKLPESSEGRDHTYLYYPIRFPRGNRYEIGRRLANAGIESKWRYYPLHLQPGFTRYFHNELPNTEKMWKDHIVLPVGPSMTNQHIDYIASVINDITGKQ